MQLVVVFLFVVYFLTLSDAYPTKNNNQMSQMEEGIMESIVRPQHNKRRRAHRNCFLSPVQCLIPVDDRSEIPMVGSIRRDGNRN